MCCFSRDDARHEHTSIIAITYGILLNMGMGGRLLGLRLLAGFCSHGALFLPALQVRRLLISACTLSGCVSRSHSTVARWRRIWKCRRADDRGIPDVYPQAQLLLSFVPWEHLSAPARHLQGRVTGGWYYRRFRRWANPAAAKIVGRWRLASRRAEQPFSAVTAVTNKKRSFVVMIRILAVLTAHGISPEYHSCLSSLISPATRQSTISIPITREEDNAGFNG